MRRFGSVRMRLVGSFVPVRVARAHRFSRRRGPDALSGLLADLEREAADELAIRLRPDVVGVRRS